MKPRDQATGRKPEPRSDSDWNREWREAQEAAEKREEARRRAWLAWEREQKERARYSPWLVIPCNGTDYGMRPLPPAEPYWASPFITVESPDPSGNPLAGAENHLIARVFNLGAATAAPTKVDFFWADPSVGLGPADAHPIGTEWTEVQPFSSRLVRCSAPWVPSYLNGGHECVFVQCDNHVLDPLLAPFEPWADRHVGQHNLAVLPAVAQTFQLWAAADLFGLRTELRVTALRGIIAPQLLAERQSPVATLRFAAHHLLGGAPRALEAHEHGRARPPGPPAVGVRIPIADAVQGVRQTGAVRRLARAAGAGIAPRFAQAPAPLAGEHLAHVDGEPGTARLLELQLPAMALRPNELVVLNIMQVAGENVHGGYVLVLAEPGWFRESPLFPLQGGAMPQQHHDTSDDALRSMVIEQFPQAQLAFTIAQALRGHLPLTSMEQVHRAAKEVHVGGLHVSPATVERFLSKDLLPVKDVHDLVRKTVGMLNIALQLTTHAGAMSPEASTFLAELGRAPGSRKAPIPSGHFTGPSIFGSTPAKGA